ncbi:hypothetical protein [Mangrovicoccus ximenensis]|uniref:hypothetical protein n=1 Tax=Mangrovicoccus ximenensis TaxID=1911570 RepID=UPI0011AE87DF|nr:hypothetical protein [Mangrovicoccus ximenensis]
MKWTSETPTGKCGRIWKKEKASAVVASAGLLGVVEALGDLVDDLLVLAAHAVPPLDLGGLLRGGGGKRGDQGDRGNRGLADHVCPSEMRPLRASVCCSGGT